MRMRSDRPPHRHPRRLAASVARVAALSLAIGAGSVGAAQAQEAIPVPSPDAEAGAAAMAPAPRILAVTAPVQPSPEGDPAAGAEASMRARGPSLDVLEVYLDHAKVIRLPERAQTVIVGNPFIADVTVQRNGILVVTGKAYGATNLIALDPDGLLLAESMISVKAPADSVVVVQRGLARESYSCTPGCQPSLRLGDSAEYFGAVGAQATQRSELAVGR